MDIFTRLNKLINQNGWSVNRLAKEAGLSQSTLSSIFVRQTIPSIPTLERICAALDITLSEFFADGSPDLSPELRRLLDTARELSPEQLDTLQAFLKTVKGE